MFRPIKRLLLGRPLPASAAREERLSRITGLAVQSGRLFAVLEAISNGIPAFKKPEAENAAATLVTMTVILLTMFLGITLLSTALNIVPHEQETILSSSLLAYGCC